MTEISFLFLVISAVFCSTIRSGEAIECYNCYTDEKNFNDDAYGNLSEFLPCNRKNLTASVSWTCPIPQSQCVYQKIEFESTRGRIIWRTCSNGPLDACDRSKFLPGVKLLECRQCKTNKCNLMAKNDENVVANPYTYKINADINLYVRQG